MECRPTPCSSRVICHAYVSLTVTMLSAASSAAFMMLTTCMVDEVTNTMLAACYAALLYHYAKPLPQIVFMQPQAGRTHWCAAAIWLLINPLELMVGTLWKIEDWELMSKGGALMCKIVNGNQCPGLVKHSMRLVLVVQVQWYKSCSTHMNSHSPQSETVDMDISTRTHHTLE